jgi:hypothetical protein
LLAISRESDAGLCQHQTLCQMQQFTVLGS